MMRARPRRGETASAGSLAKGCYKKNLAISWRDTKTMPTYAKLILACILCLAVITGLVLLVRSLF